MLLRRTAQLRHLPTRSSVALTPALQKEQIQSGLHSTVCISLSQGPSQVASREPLDDARQSVQFPVPQFHNPLWLRDGQIAESSRDVIAHFRQVRIAQYQQAQERIEHLDVPIE